MRRIIPFLLITALVAVFSWPMSARAGHVTVCRSVDAMVVQLQRDHEDAVQIARFENGDARQFISLLRVPSSIQDHQIDLILGFHRPNKPGVLFFAFENGCSVGHAIAYIEWFRRHYPDIELPAHLLGALA